MQLIKSFEGVTILQEQVGDFVISASFEGVRNDLRVFSANMAEDVTDAAFDLDGNKQNVPVTCENIARATAFAQRGN